MGATQRRLTEKVRSNPRLAVLPVFLRAPFFSRNRLIFTFVSAGVFISLTGVFYALYGYEFLHEGYIYHVTRKDNRHNFSLFFYYIYLSFETLTKVQSLLTFLP
jgi:phosphatidylinositol glycan class M